MTECRHKRLVLIQPHKEKIRCTYCNLAISKEEVTNGYCPECYHVRGVRHYEFEEIKAKPGAAVQYRCEDCGAIIEWDGPEKEA